MNRNYNLTQSYGENVKDKTPKWMDDFFNKKIEDKKENPFKNIDNFLNIGLDKKNNKND